MAEETRLVVAASLIYLPGQSHPFRPGAVVPLPVSVAADLQRDGHLAPDPVPEPVPEPPAAA